MYSSRAERTLSALAALIVVAAMVAMVVIGLRVEWKQRDNEAVVSVELAHERKSPRPLRPEARKARTSKPKETPSPRNLKNRATPLVAPPMPIILLPPKIITATVASSGAGASSGASQLPGPGQGAGDQGKGLGGGGNGGNGDGTGGDEQPVIGPRHISGKLSMADLPEGLLPPGGPAAVRVLFRVTPAGKVSDCEIDHSSGIPALDLLACRLIEERFRFRPARNRAGRPVSSRVMETHTWYVEPEPAVPPR
ncbi:MAG: energy transducer TonB [Novosphingobium sp.]